MTENTNNDRRNTRPGSDSAARKRTKKHLRMLLASSTAGAMLGTPGCADPPPPPIECTADITAETVDRHAYATARWVQIDESRELLFELSLWQYDPLAFDGEPVLEGATIVEQTILDYDIGIRCSVPEDSTVIYVTIPLLCDTYDIDLRFAVDVSETAELGAGVSVELEGTAAE